jgi:endonuclease
MRLLIARCEVLYTGRLTARLPEAVRLLMFKADGSSLVPRRCGWLQAFELHSDGVPPELLL